MKTNRIFALLVWIIFGVSCSEVEQTATASSAQSDLIETPVGDVDFPVSCEPEAAALVERGVALLHHMMYDEARFVFSMADDKDPACALAYWGQAMVLIHPLWPDTPSMSDMNVGSQMVARSLAAGGRTQREKDYLQTTRAYFEGGNVLSEGERLTRFEDAWRIVSENNPDDLEARAFFSLAMRAASSNGDAELQQQKEAGKLARSVLDVSPNHPGAHHYLIHAYDFPELAEQALEVADHYGEITPKVPHATHMMTHIYTRLGLWDKAVEWNTISADTAWELCVQTGEINLHYTHALDYLAYANLQMANDDAVVDILQTAQELQPPYSETNRDASAYAFAALPARFALERQDWSAAAALQPRRPESFPWEPGHDSYVAITYFSRAIGLARSGRPEEASGDIQMLGEIEARIRDTNPYWAKQVEIQEAAARAWQAYAMGDESNALERMADSAALEASTRKHAVTPGEVLPAAELYGDMLAESGQFADALAAYRSALQRSPRRFNSVIGAARAAKALGDKPMAAEYYAQITAIASDRSKNRKAVEEARTYLAEI